MLLPRICPIYVFRAFNKHFYKAANHTYDEDRTCGEYLSPQTKISLVFLTFS